MKILNIYNVQVQFEADLVTSGTNEQQALQAIDTINEILSLTYASGAQLFVQTHPLTVGEAEKEIHD